tara:strand:- start:41 stop:1210 length:1170 start_codon:yes stop_codon:yes gene_type:complete
MNVLSVCSGMEAASEAIHQAGVPWDLVAFSEVNPPACAVLAHKYPDVPNWGDMTKFEDWPDADVDVLVGGTPCQDFSVAGQRAGMDGTRGSLTLTFLDVARRYRPKWVVWENVPGVLSSNGGRDFGAFLGELGQCGYRWAYRILDAQFAGVPQRRRRVFVVGYFGDGPHPAAVLFERESLQGHPAPRRETGTGVAALTANGVGTCGADDNQGQAGHLIAATLSARPYADNAGQMDKLIAHCSPVSHALSAPNTASGRHDPTGEDYVAYRTSPNCGAWATGDRTDALTTGTDPTSHVIAHTLRGEGFDASEDGSGRGTPLWPTETSIRRLTPLECLRLQGFPDDYFDGVMYRNKPLADGPKYKMIGNSWAVPCVRWVFERLHAVETMVTA